MLGRPSVGVGVGAATNYTAAVVAGAKRGAASEAG